MDVKQQQKQKSDQNSIYPLCSKSPPVNYVYHKMLLNENESYLVLVAKQILLLTINNVYWYNTRNTISLSIHCARNDIPLVSVTHYFRVEINILHGPSMFDKHRKKDVKM